MDTAGLVFSQTLANEAAARWARDYAAGLTELINGTSQRVFGEVISKWIQCPGATIGELHNALKDAFEINDARAHMIAVTETTRAYANGNKIAFLHGGVKKWRWNTNNDELVCPICGPLNGMVKNIGESFGEFHGERFTEPPAHPNCRCWVTPVVDVPPVPVTGGRALDRAFSELPNVLPEGVTPEQIVRHFNEQYDVYVDLSAGHSMTPTEAQMTDKVLRTLPKKMVKDNRNFRQLALSDYYHPDDYLPNGTPKPAQDLSVFGVHHNRQITLFRLARSFTRKGVYSNTGSVFTETLLHEVGESVWKGMNEAQRADWVALVLRETSFLPGETRASEKFAIAFSFRWLGEKIPRALEMWVRGLE